MRKVLLVAVAVLLCGMYAFADDDYHKGELFAGYSYLHFGCGSGCTDNSVPVGFNIDGTYYFSKHLGLTGDFQYHRRGLDDIIGGLHASIFSIHGGPRFKAHSGKLEPFAHALFGWSRLAVSDPTTELCGGGNTCSENSFSMKLGGGLDVAAARHIAVRVGEFNYYMTRFAATSLGAGAIFPNSLTTQNNFTISAGIVIR